MAAESVRTRTLWSGSSLATLSAICPPRIPTVLSSFPSAVVATSIENWVSALTLMVIRGSRGVEMASSAAPSSPVLTWSNACRSCPMSTAPRSCPSLTMLTEPSR